MMFGDDFQHVVSKQASTFELSHSDFQNDTYRIDGVAKTFAEMWKEHWTGVYEAINFIEGSIIPGIGWQTSSNTTTPNALYLTPSHLASLAALTDIAAGLTYVLDYSLIQPLASATKPRIVITVCDEFYSDAYGYYHNGNSDGVLTDKGRIELFDFRSASFTLFGQQPNDMKVATTLSPDLLTMSKNGEANIGAKNPYDFPIVGNIEIACYTSHTNAWPEPSIATLRSITIYKRLPTAALPLYSS